MSLVPPLHFVLLDATTIHADFHSAITEEGWKDGLPTNALLICGPSKTADIQQTLAYGAHGPRELVVLLCIRKEPQHESGHSLPPDDDFRERSRAAVNDPAQRKNFRGAMDFLQAKRSAQFPDADELAGLRELGESIRRYSLAHLPQLLEQLESNLTANGIQVHWAQTAAEANAIALGYCAAGQRQTHHQGQVDGE